MNVLTVSQNKITLQGFSKLSSQIFFIFRKSGIILSSNGNEIHTDCIACKQENGIIDDSRLMEYWNENALEPEYIFVEHNNEYFCSLN